MISKSWYLNQALFEKRSSCRLGPASHASAGPPCVQLENGGPARLVSRLSHPTCENSGSHSESGLKRLLKTLVLLVALLSIQGCGRPPQVVDDEECFSAVESLWTAVTTKRTDLLEQSATELDRLHSAGKLSEEGNDALNEIIQSARGEEWMPAAKSLKAFMLGQRKTAD